MCLRLCVVFVACNVFELTAECTTKYEQIAWTFIIYVMFSLFVFDPANKDLKCKTIIIYQQRMDIFLTFAEITKRTDAYYVFHLQSPILFCPLGLITHTQTDRQTGRLEQ